MNKIYIYIFLAFVSLSNLQAQNSTANITVTVSGMKSDTGKVYIALYDKEANFLKKEMKGTIVKIEDGKASAVFKDINYGVYAVSVFHDANDNKKLDTNFLGIPKEPIGCSNKATGFMGPPRFKKAKFVVDKDIKIPVIVQ
ncbi:hypothetical protein GCM10011416_01840 [Polaribacter pacificus]|uniref:DUF2141 domain-containing protein n=1 Tax=Polaribacter pacificus TaxID=1775173 RepID=A0A917HSN6_9FLAO|nr:DUF2141 domain-containing protein [Polaribacter pacificus]GGG89065.1 hypothetical protein GCM10011416_01840 [Polaribacter pacificus]